MAIDEPTRARGKCGFVKDDGRPCGLGAGRGTAHRGEGCCSHHDAIKPPGAPDIEMPLLNETPPPAELALSLPGRYGRVQSARLQELMAEFALDPDPLNLLPDVTLLRGLIAQMIEQCGTTPTRVDLSAAARLVSDIGALADRIQKQREKGACSVAEVNALIEAFALEMVRGVRESVDDEHLRAVIVGSVERRWNAIPAPGSSGSN